MCGILGALFLPPDRRFDMDAALAAIRHRGPDANGRFHEEDVHLGHTRLAVLDLTEGGAQPMKDASGRVVVVFNGEIYNHHALRRELEADGHRFRSRSDTEVIAVGYRAWGERIFERIDGMFAIALVDLERGVGFLVRDRVGKKPLFYAEDGTGLRFASEIKAMLASGYAGEFDPASLPFLLSFGFVPAPATIRKGVRQLGAGEILVLNRGAEPVVRRYWNPPFALAGDVDVPPVEVATRTVRSLVERAVERRLEADVPVGAFLSGGIDSSIVVGVMSRMSARKVRTFSIGFEGDARFDETNYARMAATAFGTEHTEFRVRPDAFELLEALVDMHDGPFGDSSAIPTSIVSMLTRREVTVALTGDGGDELFCGYSRFIAAEAAEMVPRPVRDFARGVLGAPPPAGPRDLAHRALRLISVASRPLPDRLMAWHSYFADSLGAILKPEVASALDLEAPFAWNRAIAAQSEGAPPLARILHHNFATYLAYDLLVKADRCSMMHSLELRSPFLDTELVEYCAKLPSRYLHRGRTTKWILRRAFEHVLPPAILNRGKMGFGMPLGTWFSGSLGPLLEDRLGRKSRIYEWLDPVFVEALVRAHREGRADNGHLLWLLLTLSVWLDGRGVASTR